jgi:hypothetical protein
MKKYGAEPVSLGKFDIHLPEMMHYLYLPVNMTPDWHDIRLPQNIECLMATVRHILRDYPEYKYCYVSARRGIASPGNSLNRPGWHCDGFGTDDLNFIWWKGAGTRFAVQEFNDISDDEHLSMKQMEEQVRPENVRTYPEGEVYLIDRYVVHAVPVIERVEPRQFVKISLSNNRYNLDGNSHNYLFDYDWTMVGRAQDRNVTNK